MLDSRPDQRTKEGEMPKTGVIEILAGEEYAGEKDARWMYVPEGVNIRKYIETYPVILETDKYVLYTVRERKDDY